MTATAPPSWRRSPPSQPERERPRCPREQEREGVALAAVLHERENGAELPPRSRARGTRASGGTAGGPPRSTPVAPRRARRTSDQSSCDGGCGPRPGSLRLRECDGVGRPRRDVEAAAGVANATVASIISMPPAGATLARPHHRGDEADQQHGGRKNVGRVECTRRAREHPGEKGSAISART